MYKNKKLTEVLRERADEIRRWLFDHSSPDTSAEEFCKVANDYAIICAKIYMTEKSTVIHSPSCNLSY